MSAQTAFDFTVAFVPATRLARRRRAQARPAPADNLTPDRPRTRSECENPDGIRPCPWVSCRHHLALDVTSVGSIKLRSGPRKGSTLRNGQTWGVDDWLEAAADMLLDMPETCSLDVAGREGGVTLEEIAAMTNMSRQRVQQEEVMALRSMRRQLGLAKFNEVLDYPEDEGAES